jgi:hypothetical protein
VTTYDDTSTFYIAGPMRGYDAFNFLMFDECRDWIHQHAWRHPEDHSKWFVVSPADEDRRLGRVLESGHPDTGDYTVEWAHGEMTDGDIHALMRHDLEIVTRSKRIYLLPNWYKSEGAKAEARVAIACGVELWTWAPGSGVGDEVAIQVTPKIVEDAIYFEENLPPQEAYEADEDAITFGADHLFQDEVRIVDPETGGEKGQKLARYDLLPVEALRQVAIHYGLGARKYEDRNWEKGYAWGLSYGAAMRHLNDFWQGTDWDDDPTLGQPTRHLAAAAFHVLALLHFSTMNVGTDDRTKAVHVGRSIIAEILAEDLLTVSDKPRQGGFKVSDEHHNAFADQYRQKARDTENAWKVSPPLGDL